MPLPNSPSRIPGLSGAAQAKFDRVILPSPTGGTRELSKQQYDALPLAERISYIVEGKAQFFLNGKPITSWEALRE